MSSSYVKSLKNTFGITYLVECLIYFLLYIPRFFRLVAKPVVQEQGHSKEELEERAIAVDYETEALYDIGENAEEAIPLAPKDEWVFPENLGDSMEVQTLYDRIDIEYMNEGKRKSICTKKKVAQIKAVRIVTGWGLKESKALIDAYLKL